MKLVKGVKTVAIVTAIALVAAASRVNTTRANDGPAEAYYVAQETGEGDRRECPGPEFLVTVGRGNTATTQDTVKVAGAISEVPEFHDCQRFITGTPPNESYGALFAVFASFRLDSLVQQLDSLNANSVSKKYGVAAAEVYTRVGMYTPLGIRPGFNCLYLSNEDNWQQAYMVSSGETEEKCEMLFESTAAIPPEATVLNVRRIKVGTFAESDYPPVARWEAFAGGVYYIGIKCGDAWCQVGVPNSAKVTKAVPGAPTKTARVKHINGWFDQQRLAVRKTGTAGGLPVRPSLIRAIVKPRPILGEMNDPVPFERGWVQVGTIELQDPAGPYRSKLGLKRGVNRLLLQGRIADTVWRAMIISPSNDTTYRTVSRYPHEGKHYKIPGTLRWRWLATDETIWARCLEGCCQVQGQ